MTPYDFVHLALFAAGEIHGTTKLQKTVYFLGLMTGQLDDLGYRAHYYGPYSDEVADAVLTLEGVGFVSSRVASVGGIRPHGFEIRRIDYRLTEEGEAIARTKAEKHAELFERLEQATAALRNAGDLDYVMLSIAAKTFFMLREKKAPATANEVDQLARQFGWNVTTQQLRDAAEYLRRLPLPA